MRYTFLLLAAFFIQIPLALFAQRQWSAPPVRIADATTMTAMHDGTLVICGQRVLISSDFGSSFIISADTSFERPANIVVESGNVLLASTSDYVYRSNDHGMTWKRLNTPDGCWAIAASRSGKLFGSTTGSRDTTAGATLIRSIDGGNSWQQIPLPSSISWTTTVGVDSSNTIWLGTRSGLWFSTNDGQSWVNSNIDVTVPLVSLIEHIYVSASGDIMVTTMGGLYHGTSSSKVFSKVDNYAFGPSGYDQNGNFYASSDDEVYVSTDQGQSWSAPSYRQYLRGFAGAAGHFFALTDYLFAVSQNGTVWQQLTMDLPRIGSVGFVVPRSNGEVFVGVGGWNDSTTLGLYRSTDYGVTWSQADNGVDHRLLGLVFDYEGRAFLTTEGGLFTSTDNCASWTKLSDLTLGTIIPDSNGTLYTKAGSVSHDHGQSWQTDPHPYFAISAVPELHAVLRGRFFLPTKVFRNGTDLGYSFPLIGFNTSEYAPIAISQDGMIYADIDTISLQETRYGFAWSPDSGKHWTMSSDAKVAGSVDLKEPNLNGLFTDQQGNIFAFDDSRVLQSTDRGKTWQTYLDSTILTSNKRAFRSFYHSDDGTLYQFLKPEIISGPLLPAYIVHATLAQGTNTVRSTQPPENYELIVAPSVFHETTSIMYELPKAGHVSIQLVDALGRMIEPVYSGERGAGKNSISFDASRLAPALYFIRMQTSFGTITKSFIRQ